MPNNWQLVSNWKDILVRAWSVRLMALAAILSALEVALPALEGVVPAPPGLFAALSGIATGAAFVARLIAQRGLSLPQEDGDVQDAA